MRRILFVAMQSSVHVARWIRQLDGSGWDLHLFPVNSALPHHALNNVTIHWPLWPVRPRSYFASLRAGKLHPPHLPAEAQTEKGVLRSSAMLPVPSLALPAAIANCLTPEPRTEPSLFSSFRARMLTKLVRQLRPDVVHSLEFQHAGYLTLWSKQRSDLFPPWIATNWGSDLYFYRHQTRHLEIITKILKSIDFYSCECERDVVLAQELGLQGTPLPVFPNSGGFDLAELRSLASGQRPSSRRLIMVKGYQHFAGRALTALEAIEQCSEYLTSYEVAVFSPSAVVLPRIRAMNDRGRVNIRALPVLPHREMLQLFARARIYLGIGISDAISTSMLEAIAMGAFPIQSNTSCCDEWVEDSVSGFIVPPDNVALIAERLRRALEDNVLVDNAATINAKTVVERLDDQVLRRKTHDLYSSVFNR